MGLANFLKMDHVTTMETTPQARSHGVSVLRFNPLAALGLLMLAVSVTTLMPAVFFDHFYKSAWPSRIQCLTEALDKQEHSYKHLQRDAFQNFISPLPFERADLMFTSNLGN
uniref:Transmembrane protein n=1 Tax=Steinernema glaseri TaxID=37863 RepID=A0A1I8AGZ9_9BILA